LTTAALAGSNGHTAGTAAASRIADEEPNQVQDPIDLHRSDWHR
jgi:hypothetical protein